MLGALSVILSIISQTILCSYITSVKEDEAILNISISDVKKEHTKKRKRKKWKKQE